MLIAEAARLAAASIRRSKERVIHQARGRVDVDWLIEAYRGNEPVVTIAAEILDRVELMSLVDLVAQGFGADVVSLSTENWYAEGKPDEVVDPRTGKMWEQGAMESYVAEFGLDGVVNEGLLTFVVNRAGDLTNVAQPYVVRGREVEWLPGYPEETELFGWIPETLLKIMDHHEPELTWLIAEVGPLMGINPEQARHHMDLAAARVIEENASGNLVLALYAKKGSPRDQILRRRFSRRQVIDLGRWN